MYREGSDELDDLKTKLKSAEADKEHFVSVSLWMFGGLVVFLLCRGARAPAAGKSRRVGGAVQP